MILLPQVHAARAFNHFSRRWYVESNIRRLPARIRAQQSRIVDELARIIQERTARAWIEASRSCMAALAENAAGIQQRAFAGLLGAQQQAATIAATEVSQALSGQ